MTERENIITMNGSPLTLVGNEIHVGELAPNFEALNTELEPVKLSSLRGKVCVLSVVPSLDTPVCDTQTRRFNEAAAELSDEVVILTLSMDLPFAQKRWCGAAGADKVVTLSDHRSASFGQAYGLLIKELRLLARAVLVVDREGFLRYRQIVPEVTKEPDYDAALAAIRALG